MLARSRLALAQHEAGDAGWRETLQSGKVDERLEMFVTAY
jgi:hypothetical protein